MNLNALCIAIKEAVSGTVSNIELPGIVDAAASKVATQLEQDSQTETRLSVEIEFFLRICNTELLRSVQWVPFRVEIRSDGNGPRAVVINAQTWAVAWERGVDSLPCNT